MGHEITEHDNVVLHQKRAWHGLGIVVEDAPTPREALKIAGLDWKVKQKPLMVRSESGDKIIIDSHVANWRSDTDSLLGVVSNNYQPIQNEIMADFCEALRDEGDVKVETAGSIRSGRRTWFLLKGEEFHVAKGDQILPYILVSNGHDGGACFRVTPTTVRTVCSNTIHMVIPRLDIGELGDSAIAVRHMGDVMERVQEARNALKHYNKVLEETKQVMDHLASKNVTREQVDNFFLESYTESYGSIPANPQNEKEERQRARARSALLSFSKRFDEEREVAGSTIWTAFGAWSGLVQHDQKARGADDEDRIEKRVVSNLFGLNANRTSAALQRAFTIAQAG